MEFNHYTLPNGIRCIHKQVRSAVVNCALTVNAGSRDELPSEHGLAHLLEHAFFKGTEHRKAFHINCRLENLGGELNAYTTKEETVIHTTTLKSDFTKAAELISDIVFHSIFPQKEVDKEKLVIIDEINSYKDSPAERIYDEFEDLLFEGSSLGHNILGDKRSLMRFSKEDLLAFTARCYNTSQMVFSVIGNISPKRFVEICNRYFSQPAESVRNYTRNTQQEYKPFSKSSNRCFHQAHCIIGNRAYSLENSTDRVSMALLNNILGGPSANSLLNMEIRERKGLAYTIESGYTPYSDTGIATIYFGTDHDKVDQCTELIYKILRKTASDGINHRLLSMAKKQFIGQMVIAIEGNENYMLGAARSFLNFNMVDNIETTCKKIEAITSEDIIKVANEVYGNDLSTLIYGK